MPRPSTMHVRSPSTLSLRHSYFTILLVRIRWVVLQSVSVTNNAYTHIYNSVSRQ